MTKRKDRIYGLLSLVACFFMMVAAVARKDGKVLGCDLRGNADAEQAVTVANVDTVRSLPDGSVVVSTQPLAADVRGYAGPVPLEITIKDGRVASVKALPNSETPDFFSHAADSLLKAWDGKALDEALSLNVDAVTGATYSSRAIITNVRRGVQYASNLDLDGEDVDWGDLLSAKFIAGLIVALMAATLPLFVKSKVYRTIQLILNVVVLGLWCGTFVSYSSLMSYMAGGMHHPSMLVPLVLLVTAFLYPALLGKKSYYCANVCPFGSLQQLAAKCSKRKVTLSPVVAHRLDQMRRGLWIVLMMCVWSGVWFDWMNYELFSAFIFQSASWVVVALAVAIVVLSAFVTRPYCRFVCPTGTLLKVGQLTK